MVFVARMHFFDNAWNLRSVEFLCYWGFSSYTPPFARESSTTTCTVSFIYFPAQSRGICSKYTGPNDKISPIS